MGLFSRFKNAPKTAFAERVIELLQQAGVTEAQYDEKQFAIAYRRPDEGPGTLFLDNVYQESLGEEPEQADQRINMVIQAVVFTPDRPQDWDGVRGMLRPVIRPVTFALGAPPEAQATLSRPWQPFLQEMVVIDTPAVMSYVTLPQVSEWGVSGDEVFSAARSNLADLSGAPDPSPGSISRFVDDGNAYFVSRLLIDGWLAAFGSRPVAFIPENNILLVAAEEDPLRALLELVESEYRDAPRSISPQAYTVGADGRVVPFPILPGHPAAASLHRAATILASSEYARQKHHLDQSHEAQGKDIFTASHTAAQRPDESLFSYTVWAAATETLLPRADYVGMANPDGSFFVAWSVLAEYVDLVAAPGLSPPRYRVADWPEPSIVEALRSRQVTP